MTRTGFGLQKASKKDINEIRRLLSDNDLPVRDLDYAPVRFYLLMQDDQLVGLGGIENLGETGLLRSVIIKKSFRNNNLGMEMVSRIIEEAKKMKIHQLYLLTTTAEGFFRKLGFTEAERDKAPKSVQSTNEFSNLCPESANFMVLNIK